MGAGSSRDAYDAEEEQESLLGGGGSGAAARLAGVKDDLKARLGLAPTAPAPKPTRMQRMLSCLPELSYTTRIAGFCFCFFLGWVLSLTSLTSIGSLLVGNPLPFAFKYTLGNLLSICSFGFIQGPARQCQGMCAPERRLSTCCYLGSFVATLFSVFYLHSRLWTMVALGVQLVAALLYALSYLPAGLRYAITRRLFGAGWA